MKALLWLWGKVKTVPVWIWLVVVAVGLLVTTILGWRRAAARLAAALESARSAERTVEIEKTAVDEHAVVADELAEELAEIDDKAEVDVAVLEDKAEAVEVAEDKADGSLADLANKHFGNQD